MSRPRKVDALSPAERARRYRLRRSGCVTETVTKTLVTETVTVMAIPRVRVAPQVMSEADWPFPGSRGWFERHGYCRMHPGV